MKQCKVHVLFEYGVDLRPHGSAYIRLLRPLRYPSNSDALEVTADLRYEGQDVDAVIVDRLWRPDISCVLVEKLVDQVRHAGARLLYALDDNFLDLPARRLSLVSGGDAWPTEGHRRVVRFLLSQADGVIVTTQALKEQLTDYNSKIQVVRNALDERLVVGGGLPPLESPFGKRRKVIGYMGTLTHDDDLKMILPAWRAVWERHRQEIEFQIVGVVGDADTMPALEGLPIRFVSPKPDEVEYPLFMLWFTSRLGWDIALSPLADTPFNRCKSDIKFLDYSAIGAAGIYSQVSAYESSVEHLKTGWLIKNDVEAWTEAIEELLCNNHLRAHLSQNATRYLYTERTLAHRAQDRLEALGILLDGR